jgi:hypothetical protein
VDVLLSVLAGDSLGVRVELFGDGANVVVADGPTVVGSVAVVDGKPVVDVVVGDGVVDGAAVIVVTAPPKHSGNEALLRTTPVGRSDRINWLSAKLQNEAEDSNTAVNVSGV